MKADTQIEPLFRQRTHRKKKEGKKNNLAWDNVSHAQCDECLLTGALTDDLYRDTTLLRRPPAPEAGTTWKNWPPWNPFHHAWRSLKSVGSFCPLCQDGVGRSGGGGGLTKLHGSLHSRNSWIKPYSVLHAVVSLSPSLIAVITDSAPIEVWQTERQMSLHADRQSCAVHQSSTLLPRYESAGLTINSVPWVQWLLPYSDRLAGAASPSLHHKYTRRSSY